MTATDLFGLPLSLDADEPAVLARVDAAIRGESTYVSFVNPHAWALKDRIADYAGLLAGMDLVLADGIAVAKAAGWTTGAPVSRLSFDTTSLYLPVLGRLEAQGGGLFVVGAKPGVAERAVARMRRTFPGIDYKGVLDGYLPEAEAVDRILAARPHMVLCGMGAPYQERFLARLREAGFAGIAFTCGGFLDQLAETERYYPGWVDRLEARWLYRLVREPRRLWRRYLVEYRPFLAQVLRARLRGATAPLTGPLVLPGQRRA